MAECVQAQQVGRAAKRALALVLLATLLLPAATGGPGPAQAAPAAQARNLCTLVPPGWDPASLDDRPDYCYVVYNEADGTMLNLKLSKAASPELAYILMDPKPDDCAAGLAPVPCSPLDKGDVAPPGAGHSYKGVTWKGGQGYAWRRGCYLLVGETLWSTEAAKKKQLDLMLKADALLGTAACPGCADPSACQGAGPGSGSGGTPSVCGTGVPAPAGPFAVSGYGCQYEEATDGVTCQATVVNACPDADLWYEWSMDGVPTPGYIDDVFDPTGLGLCAGEHTVGVTATDAKNNLTATGISWTFTSTQGPPCGGASGAALSVSGPACTYLSGEDRVLCTAQVVDAPSGADIEYEWKWNGAVQAETGAMLDILVSADFQVHTFEVTARDKASGANSAPSSTTVQVGQPPLVTRPEYIQIETRNGLFEIPGLDGGQSTRLEAQEGDDSAKLFAVCPDLYRVTLMQLAYSEDMTMIADWSVPIRRLDIVISSILLKCAGGLAEAGQAREVAAVGDAALVLPAQAPEDLPVQLRIEMLGGPMRLGVTSDQVLVDVQTSEASVRSAGKNDFGVAFDPQTGDTTVAVFDGVVEVYSMGSALQLGVLQAGEHMTVSRGQASAVTRTAGEEGGAGSILLGLGCLAGMALLAALVIWAVVRSRRKKASPGAAAAVRPTPAQALRPTAPGRAQAAPQAGPRLVVAAGRAMPQAVHLSGGPVMIGRGPSCTIVVDDVLVADHHAQVSLQGRFWVVEDLGSAAGTFLAGVRIERQALRPGDRIQVGRTVLQFEV